MTRERDASSQSSLQTLHSCSSHKGFGVINEDFEFGVINEDFEFLQLMS